MYLTNSYLQGGTDASFKLVATIVLIATFLGSLLLAIVGAITLRNAYLREWTGLWVYGTALLLPLTFYLFTFPKVWKAIRKQSS